MLRLVSGVVCASTDGPPLSHQVPPNEELPDHLGDEKTGASVFGRRWRIARCFAATVAVGVLRLVCGVVCAASNCPPLLHQVPPNEEHPDHLGDEKTGASV